MIKPKLRSALLVDFDNIYLSIGDPFVDSVQAWTAWLEDGALSPDGRQRTLAYRNVSWNTNFDHFRNRFERHGFTAQSCQAEARTKIEHGKSSADIWLAMDAVDLSQGRARVDEVILLSCDTDFVPVINRLQQRGIEVLVAGDERTRSLGIHKKYAETMSMNALLQACSYQRQALPFWRKRVAPVADPDPQLPQPKIRRPAPPPAAGQSQQRQTGSHKAGGASQNASGSASRPATIARRNVPTAKLKRSYDVAGAAQAIADVALLTPRQPVPRAVVERTLKGFPGFSKEPTRDCDPWLGLGAYHAMILEFARIHDDLALTSGKSPQLMYIGAGAAEPSED